MPRSCRLYLLNCPSDWLPVKRNKKEDIGSCKLQADAWRQIYWQLQLESGHPMAERFLIRDTVRWTLEKTFEMYSSNTPSVPVSVHLSYGVFWRSWGGNHFRPNFGLVKTKTTLVRTRTWEEWSRTSLIFSRVHATLQPALSVHRSVGPSVRPSVGPSVRHTLLFYYTLNYF